MKQNMGAETNEKGNVLCPPDLGTRPLREPLDRPQPHAPDQGAAGIDHAPVAGKFTSRRVGGVHSGLGADEGGAPSSIGHAVVYRSQGKAGAGNASPTIMTSKPELRTSPAQPGLAIPHHTTGWTSAAPPTRHRTNPP